MKRRKLPIYVAVFLSLLMLRFTGIFSFLIQEGVADECAPPEVPVIPSFSLDSYRNKVEVSLRVPYFMRSEIGRQEYEEDQSIPMPVRKYLNVFTTSGRKDFLYGLLKAERYRHELAPVLKLYGLPPEMLILAYIESDFKIDARSSVNAVGPWQFMEGTAKRYGLRVDSHVDEREDMLKSTHAAGRYLRDLVREFGSLELALAAYNTGENRVRSAVTSGRTTDFWILAAEGYFSQQTVNHVAKFSAAMLLASEQNDDLSQPHL